MLVMPNRKAFVRLLAVTLRPASWRHPMAPAWSQAAKAPNPRSALPKTPAERDKTLSDLYALLATADDEESAKAIADAIERIWQFSGSATIDVLMERSIKALAEKKNDLALKLLNYAVEIAPDFTEAWNRRAYVHFVRNDFERALGDLQPCAGARPQPFQGARRPGPDPARDRPEEAGAQGVQAAARRAPLLVGAKEAVEELERERRSTARGFERLGRSCRPDARMKPLTTEVRRAARRVIP